MSEKIAAAIKRPGPSAPPATASNLRSCVRRVRPRPNFLVHCGVRHSQPP